jgi:pyruvate formate lyase activating enzyme
MKGFITNIQRFSIHDGPGIRTTVFFKGCPLSCRWCQNPEAITNRQDVIYDSEKCIGCKTCVSICPEKCMTWDGRINFTSDNCTRCGLCIDNCPVQALRWSSKTVSASHVIHEVLKDRVYYDISGGGITLSGGEPLQQIDFCHEILKKSKKEKLNTALDTSGYAPSKSFKKIMPLVDLFLFDIKFINSHLHEEYTGKTNELILENFRLLCQSKRKIIVRIPIIPGFTDSKVNIRGIESFVKKNNSSIVIEKIPFNPLMEKKYKMLGLPYTFMNCR